MFELKTVAIRPDGCFSVLLCDGRPFAVTCEHVFADGKPAIKNGTWRCRKRLFEHGGYFTFEIIIPGHDLILFHRGNTELDSKGCVLVAESFTVMNGLTGIADSKGGFTEFWGLAHGVEEFDLVVSGDAR